MAAVGKLQRLPATHNEAFSLTLQSKQEGTELLGWHLTQRKEEGPYTSSSVLSSSGPNYGTGVHLLVGLPVLPLLLCLSSISPSICPSFNKHFRVHCVYGVSTQCHSLCLGSSQPCTSPSRSSSACCTPVSGFIL